MSHLHSVYDTDKHFVIDPITRNISTESNKLVLTRYDHNSERFTFEIPRYIEGHDMFECNQIEIHADNIGKINSECNSDVYTVDDKQLSPDDENIVIFSWLISRAFTQIVGKLSFSIDFACIAEDGVEEYSWGTNNFDKVSINNRIHNTQKVIEEHSDFVGIIQGRYDELAKRSATKEEVGQLSEEIEDLKVGVDKETIKEAVNEYLDENPIETNPDADIDVELSTDELEELNATIEKLQSLKKSNTAIVAFLTDLHMSGWTAVKSKKAVAGYNKISSSVKTDLLLFGGDYLENSPSTTKEQALTWYSDLRAVLAYCNNKAPIAVIKGNHDDNTMYTDYANGLIDFETFWTALGNIDDDRTNRNAGNIEDCYGYYDIPNQKIRVFYLNTVDIPQKLITVTNTLNYKAQWDTGISIEQLQFVADNLKFDTSGWHVMVCSHHPLMYNIALENACGVKADRGGSALLELLDKFNSNSGSGSISVTGTDFKGEVTYDFTANEDCKVIACVNGHTHRDGVDVYNDSFVCISTRAVNGHPSHEGHISSSAYFVVDRNEQKLHLVYNGDGEEKVFKYDSLTVGEEEDDTETVYEQIASPFTFEIGALNDTTGKLEADSQKMRISTTKPVGFTAPTIIDFSSHGKGYYQTYWYDTDGNYIENGASWLSYTTPLEVPVDRMIGFKVRNNNYELWDDTTINTFASAVKVYVEEGGEAYFADGAVNPEEPEPDVQIAPFDWKMGYRASDEVAEHTPDSQNMRAVSDFVTFDGDATISFTLSTKYPYTLSWYNKDGSIYETSDGWQTASSVTVYTDKILAITVREKNYAVWTEDSISELSNSISVVGGKVNKAEIVKPPISVVGEPLTNVTYRIGAGPSNSEAYANNARIIATQQRGVKPYSNSNVLWQTPAYPITIPETATKIIVTCPDFIFGLTFANYENDAYVTANETGWRTLGGGEYSFEAGAYGYVNVSFKNSSNSAIPTDTDTSGFSIMFE